MLVNIEFLKKKYLFGYRKQFQKIWLELWDKVSVSILTALCSKLKPLLSQTI